MIALAGLSAFVVAATCTGWILWRVGDRWLVDHPNERSLHRAPVSRGGGIAIAAGVTGGCAVGAYMAAAGPELLWLAMGAVLVGAVSFADDLRGVSPGLRILVHVIAALCVVQGGFQCERIILPGLTLDLGYPGGVVFTVLVVVWTVNLFNFMDGIDGYAAGMATIGFTTLAALCALSDEALLAAATLATGASAFGFLLFNFPPARIFMGDLGSTVLGYLCAAAMLAAEHADAAPLWVSVLIFSPVVVDATVTLAARILAGNRPWRAHKNHFSQRLVRLGWGHRKTVLRGYALMLGCAGSAVAAHLSGPMVQFVLICGWVVFYAALMLGVARLERISATASTPGQGENTPPGPRR